MFQRLIRKQCKIKTLHAFKVILNKTTEYIYKFCNINIPGNIYKR